MYGERATKRRRVDVKMQGFETVNEMIATSTGLFKQRFLLKPPAFMRERGRDFVVALPVPGGQNGQVWRPYTPIQFFENNQHWARCVGNLAYIAGASELVTGSGIHPTKFRKSRVISWIDKIRCLCHARDTRKLPNPTVAARAAAAGDRRRKADDLLWDGAKLTNHTFCKMVRDLRSQLDSRARACVFPYYPHIDTQADIVENYKLCVLHSSTPGEMSDAHMKLACMLEACCPYMFPSVPASNGAIGEELVDRAAELFHDTAGMDDLARKFTGGLRGNVQTLKSVSQGHRDTGRGIPLRDPEGPSRDPTS